MEIALNLEGKLQWEFVLKIEGGGGGGMSSAARCSYPPPLILGARAPMDPFTPKIVQAAPNLGGEGGGHGNCHGPLP